MDGIKENRQLIMKLSCVVSNIIKKLHIVLLIMLICGVGNDVIKTLTYQPLYAASMNAMMVTEANTYSQLDQTVAYIKTMNYIFNGQVANQYVKEKLQSEDVDLEVTLNSVNNTNQITMQVISSSKKNAYYGLKYLTQWYNSNRNQYNFPYELNVQTIYPISNTPINVHSHFSNLKNGCLISAVLSVFVLGVYYYFRDTIKTPYEIDQRIDCRLFAKIPHERKPRGKKFWIKSKQALLITSLKTSFYYKESIKKLRSRLEESATKHHYQVIMVTSSLENEGKSSVAANLALSLAENKKKVLLIDADLRKPSLNKIFSISSDRSINQYLEGKSDWISQIDFLKKNQLDVLCADANVEDAEEMVISERMQKLLKEAIHAYDYVIVDSSPARFLNESVMLNELMDATLLVIKQDVASTQVINETILRLVNSKNNLIGCVYNSSVNDFLKESKAYGYRYGYSRYRRA